MFQSTMLLKFLASFVLLATVVSAGQLLKADTFDSVENVYGNNFVVFYHSSNDDAQNTLDVVEIVAQKLKKQLPDLKYISVDGAQEHSQAKFDGAGFAKDKVHCFTKTNEGGIQKYPEDVVEDVLEAFLLDLFREFNDKDVVVVESEKDIDDALSKGPVFLKCFETWCAHCKQLKPSTFVFSLLYSSSLSSILLSIGSISLPSFFSFFFFFLSLIMV